MIAIIVLAAAAATAAPQQFSALPLDVALQRGVTNSPDVAQAQARVRENEALLAAARGSVSPALTANYAQSPQAGNLNNTVIQKLTTFGADVTLGNFLAYSPAVREAQFTLASAQFDLLDAQRAERVKVVGEYYDALRAQATVRLRVQGVAGAQRDLDAAQLRFRAGDAPRLDVVRAQVALDTAEAQLGAARVDGANAQNALSVETNEPVETLAAVGQAAPAAPPSDPQRAVDRALAQRSDLLSAQEAVKAEAAAIHVAERAIDPALTVSAGYTTGVDTGISVHGPSANVTLSIPVSSAAAHRAAAERARFAEAQYKEQSIRRQIVVSVGAAARTYAQSVDSARAAARARAAAEQELQATETGYRNGASSSLDVADARRTYEQAAVDELNAVYAQAQAAATLEQEMGP